MKKMLALLCCVLLCAACVLPAAADETTTTTESTTTTEQTTTTTTEQTTTTETTTTTTTDTTTESTTTTTETGEPIATRIEVAEEGEQYLVTLTDASGNPLAEQEIYFHWGSNAPTTHVTDENGQCRIDKKPNGDVRFVFVARGNYLGCQYPEATTAPSTTTSTTKPTTTTTQTGPTTTQPRPSTEPGATTTVPSVNTTATAHGTTSQQNGMVAVGVAYDDAVLSGFGLAASGFTSYARMMLTPAYYAQLAASGMPLLSLSQAEQVSEQQVLEATGRVNTDESSNNDMLRGYGASDIRFFTVNIGLYVFTEDGQAVAATNYPEQVGVTVCLPLPAHMKNAAYVAVCAPTGDGLVPPIVVPVNDGVLQFGIASPAAYTIVAYGTASVAADEEGGFPIGTLLALIAGLLAVVAAMVCLYLFVIRGSRFARDPDDSGYTAPKKVRAAKPAKQPRERRRREPPQEEDSFLSLADLEDPFKPLHVEKNDVTEDIALLKREKAKRDIKDFDVDL